MGSIENPVIAVGGEFLNYPDNTLIYRYKRAIGRLIEKLGDSETY